MTPKEKYNDLLERISKRPRQQKARLLAELPSLVRKDDGPKLDIMDLAGLGKEIWEGIDAQEYVDRERDSWNG